MVRADDRVRINARLIDGTVDHQVWSNQYERDVRDILAGRNAQKLTHPTLKN